MTSLRSRPASLHGARTLVLSPHLDDALLSATAFVLTDPSDVWTVFAGRPHPPRTTSWDEICGFADSDETLTARVAEDTAAFADTPARVRRLDALEGPYVERDVRVEQLRDVRADIERWLDENGANTLVLAPAGAGIEVPDAPWAPLQRRLAGLRATSSAGSTPPPEKATADEPVVDTGTSEGPKIHSHGSAIAGRIKRAVRGGVRVPLALARRALHAEHVGRRRRAAKGGRLAANPDHLALRDLVLDLADERPDMTVVLYEELPYLWHGSADAAVARICAARGMEATGWSEQIDTDLKFTHLRHYTSQMPVMDTAGRLLAARHLPTRERYWLLTPSSSPTPS